MAADGGDNKAARRSQRDDALRELNTVATALKEDAVARRANTKDAQEFFVRLCSKVEAPHLDALRAGRQRWMDSGGCDLEDSVLQAAVRRIGKASTKGSEENEGGAAMSRACPFTPCVAAKGATLRVNRRRRCVPSSCGPWAQRCDRTGRCEIAAPARPCESKAALCTKQLRPVGPAL